MAFHQNPLALFVDVSRKRQVVIVQEAQVQSQHGTGMIHRPAPDHLLLVLLLHWITVLGLDVQLGSLGRRKQ